MTGDNTNYTVPAGSSVHLLCEVTATPSITGLAWYKDGALLNTSSSSDSRLSNATLSRPSLTISQVVEQDEGVYVCSATNQQGTTNGTGSVLVVLGGPVWIDGLMD